ncbi:MAG: hypothetical protein ABI151_17360 [Chitinophagaceae bacterium]
MKRRSLKQAGNYLLLIIAVATFIAGCNDNPNNKNTGLTFNAENARQHVMPLNEALKYTARFKDSKTRLDSAISGNNFFKEHPFKLLNGEYFNRDAIIALLDKAEKGGIRIYLGQDEKGTLKFILVPATEKQDYLTKLVAFNGALKIPGMNTARAAPFQDYEVMERGQECPNMCPEGSPFTDQR